MTKYKRLKWSCRFLRIAAAVQDLAPPLLRLEMWKQRPKLEIGTR
ncbi:hypothetical protein AALP_AAs53536U000100 [Arabis alpina]|uniref:Uncharacterized protein n=1 Tax=Arabis alpina TaxID=50452 RepID=A0A087G1R3_ARAAL|nr:hypothetical protein AALP_AAs53536U000100 [Arabis alpina]